MSRTTMMRALSMGCAMLTLSIAVPANAATSERADLKRPRIGNVQKALEALADHDGVVGAIGEVYVDGKRVGHGSAGSRLLDGKGGKIPSTAHYRIGSQTKQLTATVLLQLVEEGKVGLDDKLSDVLPEVARQNLVERADEITVRQLIRHTSGIPDYLAKRGLDVFDFTTYSRPVDLLKLSRKQPRTVEPGTYQYSNTNYILLGMIIERLTHRTLAAELERRLFTPIGMHDTYLPIKPPQGIEGPHGHGYFPDDTGTPRDVDRINASKLWAAGGIVSTARDVSAFQRAFAQGRLLPPSLQKVISDPPEGLPPLPAGGLCEGEPEIEPGHAGSAPGFVAATYTSTDGRLQFAVSTTTSIGEAATTLAPVISQAAKAVFCPTK